jgi:hypothetical protein
MSEATTKRLSFAEIFVRPEFQTLTKKQQIFCARYISSGVVSNHYDASDAAAFAYSTKNPAVLGQELLGQRKVRAVLDLHFGRNEFDGLVADLRRLLKRADRRGSDLNSLAPDLKKVLTLLEQHLAKDKS